MSKKHKIRKVIAIGDLHGDYNRLMRYFYEQKLLIEDTWVWNPEANNIDLIFVGDYVDWRGEPLEGDITRWQEGSRRVVYLIYHLYRKLEEYRKKIKDFESFIFPALGNHDQMMIEAMEIFDFLNFEKLEVVISFNNNFLALRKYLADINLNYQQIEKVMRFLNWYYQGGNSTVQSFGGLDIWKREMEGEIGDFFQLIAHALQLQPHPLLLRLPGRKTLVQFGGKAVLCGVFRRINPAVAVEQEALVGAVGETGMLVLRGDVEQRVGQRFDRAGTDRTAAEGEPAALAPGNAPLEDQRLFAVPGKTAFGCRRQSFAALRAIKDRAYRRLLRALPDKLRVGARPQRQPQRPGDKALARASLAGDYVEAGGEFNIRLRKNNQIFDIKLAQHSRSAAVAARSRRFLPRWRRLSAERDSGGRGMQRSRRRCGYPAAVGIY